VLWSYLASVSLNLPALYFAQRYTSTHKTRTSDRINAKKKKNNNMSFAATSFQSSALFLKSKKNNDSKSSSTSRMTSSSKNLRGVVRVSASGEDAEAAAQAAKIKVTDVKETLGRGFILVDIRSPEEVQETGSKFSWEKIPIARMDEDGNPISNPNFLAQIKDKFPNSMSRILLACDDGTFRSELAHRLITQKLGYSQVKIIDGGIDAYIEFQPLTKEDKIKVRMVAQAGNDLSVLVSGVDTRQAGQKYY
jgi:rhodanese-related sulfurtransferase